jgi:hypothetical protein
LVDQKKNSSSINGSKIFLAQMSWVKAAFRLGRKKKSMTDGVMPVQGCSQRSIVHRQESVDQIFHPDPPCMKPREDAPSGPSSKSISGDARKHQ